MSTLSQIDNLLSTLESISTDCEKKEEKQEIIKGSKIIVITGVTSGFGNALAHGFLSKGYFVSGCGRNELKLKELNNKYKNNPNCLFSKVDVTNENSVILWAKNTISKFNDTPRLIINNVGQLIAKPVLNCSGKEFNQILNVNVISQLYVIKAFLKYMKDNTKFNAFIANVSSANFGFYEPNLGPYITSKFAVEGLTRSIAPELPSHIGICSMWPGAQFTKMTINCYTEKICKELKLIKSSDFIKMGTPNVIDWFMLLNKKKHNGLTVGPKAEYLSLLPMVPPDTALKLSAGNGYPFQFIYPDE